jgi:hypothetical protein
MLIITANESYEHGINQTPYLEKIIIWNVKTIRLKQVKHSYHMVDVSRLDASGPCVDYATLYH